MFILEKLLDTIAPFTCVVCDFEGTLLCEWCKPDACMPVPPRCYKCQKQTTNSEVCQTCRRQSRLKNVWVVTEYEGVAKQLIQSLKFGYKRPAAIVIAEYIDEILPYMDKETIIVHIPTASSRIRQRGFDQSSLIARSLAKNRQLRIAPLLHRRGNSRQVGAKRPERAKQLLDAFWISKASELRGKSVLLVDDVLTTGATIESAAQTVKKAGAKSVSAVIFAQAK